MKKNKLFENGKIGIGGSFDPMVLHINGSLGITPKGYNPIEKLNIAGSDLEPVNTIDSYGFFDKKCEVKTPFKVKELLK